MGDSVRILVRDILRRAVEAVHGDGLFPDLPAQILFERPKRAEHGNHTMWARYMEAARAVDAGVPEVALPENGYRDYIRGIGRKLFERDGKRWVGSEPPADMDAIGPFAIDSCLAMIRSTLARFEFDIWQSERALHEAGEVQATLEILERAGFIDRRDDAVWLRTTALSGDDKDRVVVPVYCAQYAHARCAETAEAAEDTHDVQDTQDTNNT